METQKILEKIQAGIETAKSRGYELVCEDWGDDNQKCACPLGCLIVANDAELGKPTENFNKAAELLGLNEQWIDSFIAGFDKGYLTYGEEPIKEAKEMGTKLRAELDPLRYHVYLAKRDHQND